MASNTDSAPPNAQSTPPRQRGSRGGFGGPRNDHDSRTDQHRSPRAERGGRGQSRGRGGRGRGRGGNSTQSTAHSNNVGASVAHHTPHNAIDPGGTSGERPTGGASMNQGVGAGKQVAVGGDEEEDVEAEVCFICASPVVHNAVAPCNHRTCHICSLRLRALYKTKQCAHCRTQADLVVFTDDPVKRFEDFTEQDFFRVDGNLGIKYEKEDIFEDTVLLLRYNCPDEDCDVACLGWPDLHRHTRSVHQKVMCDLCTRNKKVFTHEHDLFTQADLRKHEKFGDDNPGAVDQTGFKGHPECGFCRRRFYGDDELYSHCREKHERCHICDRRSGGQQPQYYLNYDALETHFRKDHFMCPDRECLEKKFVVFESEMDLKAHQIEAHPNGLTKDALRDARRVDMSDFSFREPYQHNARRGRDGPSNPRGRGRGRDPNAEPLPASTAQPLRRDEVAFQRQMAIQSAQSVATRTFGGQLTATPTEVFAARPQPGASTPVAVGAHRPPAPRNDFPSLAPVAAALPSGATSPRPRSPAPEATLTQAEQARRLRHTAVVERAATMLRNDQTKISDFRQKISLYRASGISALDLIESFFSLFDSPSAAIGKLIKELADIFEIAEKRDGLLRAWNDWKAINEDYPSLPGSSSTASASQASTHGGKRVLKLKSSTAQSSRSAVGRKGGWGTTSSQNLFPPVAAPVATSIRAGSGRVGPTPWASSGSASLPAVSSQPVSRSGTPAVRGPAAPGRDAFPALPAAAKPASTVFSPGYRGSGVRRDAGGAGVNAWNPASAAGDASSDPAATEEANDSAAKRKGNKGKKQLLMHFG